MLLKKLSLKNFRPFKGDHVIEFSVDKTKNVTLVMAENGAGKTTLAQAFQWTLYGKTDGFKNKSVLNSTIDQQLDVGQSTTVESKLEIEHNGIDYTIIRKQNYKKDSIGPAKQEASELEIYFQKDDGQTVVNNNIKNLATISSILPESLSKYFFFDGERIEKMAGEVTEGKSDEFKNAVQNILGLTALTKAIDHLNPNQKNSVIGRYNQQLDAAGDQKTKELRQQIYDASDIIEKNKEQIENIEDQINYYSKEIEKVKSEILTYADAEKLQKQLNELNRNLDYEVQHKNTTISTLMKNFTRGTRNYMAQKLIAEALNELKNTDNIDKGIPEVRDTTIKYLINRKKCLCGTDLSDPTSEANVNLTELLKYIPPQSLGTAINHFQNTSVSSIQSSNTYLDTMRNMLSNIRSSSNKIESIEHEIGDIDKSILKSSNTKVTDLKQRQIDMENTKKSLEAKRDNLKVQSAINEEKKKEAEAEISRLQLKIEKNKILELQLEYAREAYNKFKATYDYQEAKTRENLEDQINSLFKQIYAGGMTINIDDRYRITSYVNELEESSTNLDANTARSYSIIFAFIVGVINLAKQKVNDSSDDSSIVTDEYPLVMDAPLSSFDQRRIQNICSVIPTIARQVIIFIKDSDGNIAKREMKDKIGKEYEVTLRDKDYPVDSLIKKVGE